MKEVEYIVCNRVAHNPTPITGSTVTHCVKCDAPVWFAPTSHTHMMEYDAKPLCGECAIAIAPPDVKIHPPTPEQAKEILRDLKKRKEEKQ